MAWKKRSRLDIIADILSVAKEGSRPTRIMYQTNLSFRRQRAYLDDMVGMGLLEARTHSPVMYFTTEQGREWLRNYEKIKL